MKKQTQREKKNACIDKKVTQIISCLILFMQNYLKSLNGKLSCSIIITMIYHFYS